MFIPYLSFQPSRHFQPKRPRLNLGCPRTRKDIFCSCLKKTKVIHGISYILSLISFQPHSGSFRLGSSRLQDVSLWLLLSRVAWPRLAPFCLQAIRHASVSDTDTPSRRGSVEACPAQTPTAIGSTPRRCSPSCRTSWRRLHSSVPSR